jgi:hypothetical protein
MTISYVLNIKLSDKFNTKFFCSRLTIFLQIDKGRTITLHFKHGNTD